MRAEVCQFPATHYIGDVIEGLNAFERHFHSRLVTLQSVLHSFELNGEK